MSGHRLPHPSDLAPVFRTISRHPVFPDVSHDENARLSVLGALSKHLSSVLLPGNKVAFEKRARPLFRQQTGDDVETRQDVHRAMRQDSHYQLYSALRRSMLEMTQQASRALVLRQLDELVARAKQYNEQRPDTLQLDPSLRVPDYMRLIDSHCLPGSYYTEYVPNDITNAAIYEASRFVTTGRSGDEAGRALVTWLKQQYPDFRPRRILDVGCGLGQNTLPLAMAYPEADIVGLDVSAPMLRYAHAQAVALGIPNVRFRQANAEAMPFDDESFDWVQSTLFLHETSIHAMAEIGREIRRVLRPGGLTLHIEQPQFTPEMPVFEQFMRDWDAFNNNLPYLSVLQELDRTEWLEQTGFARENVLEFSAPSVDAQYDITNPTPTQPEDYGRPAVWNVFGAWKTPTTS